MDIIGQYLAKEDVGTNWDPNGDNYKPMYYLYQHIYSMIILMSAVLITNC